MKVLELFAGSRSFGRVAKERGHEVFSVDNVGFEGIDLVKDVEHLTGLDLPWRPDVVWASPPCTTYSIAAISTHRRDGEPKTEFAVKSDRLVKNTLKIAKAFETLYFIENPVGYLRKMPFMQGVDRRKVTYCTYGDGRMKPTDIFSNHFRSLANPSGWSPRRPCHNGNPDCHHQSAPRGAKTGTQGLKGNYERSKVPRELCEEVLASAERYFQETL